MGNLQCVAVVVTNLQSKYRSICDSQYFPFHPFCCPSVEITEMSRRLPRLVHEDQTDVCAEVGRKVMAEVDAKAEIGGDGVSKASALGGLDVKDYSLMAVLGCWKETVEALDRSARYGPAEHSEQLGPSSCVRRRVAIRQVPRLTSAPSGRRCM